MTAAHHGKAFHGGEHYENFPVGSWLVPRSMRQAVLLLYRYARTGDDLADEGHASSQERIGALLALRDGLHLRPNPLHPTLATIGQELRQALDDHKTPFSPADDLLDAFLQDAAHQPMQTEADVLVYCSRSANPIGRLVLLLAGLIDATFKPTSLTQASDAICTGLQLANFAQDMGQDVSRGRIYLPQQWLIDMRISDVHETSDTQRAALAERMAQWALDKLDQGAGLARMIRTSGMPHRWRLAIEIAITLEGGREICRQVMANPAAVWKTSPAISKKRLAVIGLRALRRL